VIRTFLDAGVLIAATRTTGAIGVTALALFNATDRVFVTSEFVRMEVLPKALYYQRQAEVAFYERFFARATRIVRYSESLRRQAYTEACTTGLAALDALHIAAARAGGATEFITTERRTSPLFRVTGLTITTLDVP
jgi:predicted nucleic acid-binding protein